MSKKYWCFLWWWREVGGRRRHFNRKAEYRAWCELWARYGDKFVPWPVLRAWSER